MPICQFAPPGVYLPQITKPRLKIAAHPIGPMYTVVPAGLGRAEAQEKGT